MNDKNYSEMLKYFGGQTEIEVDALTLRRVDDTEPTRETPTLDPADFVELRIVRGDVLRAEIWERNKDLFIDERENEVEMAFFHRIDDDDIYLLGIHPRNHEFEWSDEFSMTHPEAPDVVKWHLSDSNPISGEIRARAIESD